MEQRTISKLNIEVFNLPVRVYSTIGSDGTGLNQVCEKGHRIKYKRMCQECNKEVSYSDIFKGFKLGDDIVVLSREQVEALKEADKVITTIGVIDQKNIDIRTIQKTYYLYPESDNKMFKNVNLKFALLKDSLKAEKKAILVKFCMRSRESLGIIQPYKEHLLLIKLAYPENLKSVDITEYQYSKEYLTEFKKRLIGLVRPIKQEELKDNYAERLRKLITESVGKKPKKKIEKKEEQPENLFDELDNQIKKKIKVKN